MYLTFIFNVSRSRFHYFECNLQIIEPRTIYFGIHVHVGDVIFVLIFERVTSVLHLYLEGKIFPISYTTWGLDAVSLVFFLARKA